MDLVVTEFIIMRFPCIHCWSHGKFILNISIHLGGKCVNTNHIITSNEEILVSER